jgi:hypothetical protein
MFRNLLAGAAVAVLVSVTLASQASAAVITNGSGSFSVGIGLNGELYDAGANVGFGRASDGFDSIAQGVGRDSWGANGDLADDQNAGASGVSTTVVSGAHSAVATTTTAGGLTIIQNYSFSGQNILSINTTITNTSGAAQSVLFGRDLDWDLDANFNESSLAPIGSSPFVIDSSEFGFEDAAATTPYNFSCTDFCPGTGDLGAGIRIDLGQLAAGQSMDFSYFYGLNLAGDSVGDLIGQTQAAGAQYILAGTGDGGANSMTLGFGVPGLTGGVPEPASWAMMIVGFFGIGALLRRGRETALSAA